MAPPRHTWDGRTEQVFAAMAEKGASAADIHRALARLGPAPSLSTLRRRLDELRGPAGRVRASSGVKWRPGSTWRAPAPPPNVAHLAAPPPAVDPEPAEPEPAERAELVRDLEDATTWQDYAARSLLLARHDDAELDWLLEAGEDLARAVARYYPAITCLADPRDLALLACMITCSPLEGEDAEEQAEMDAHDRREAAALLREAAALVDRGGVQP